MNALLGSQCYRKIKPPKRWRCLNTFVSILPSQQFAFHLHVSHNLTFIPQPKDGDLQVHLIFQHVSNQVTSNGTQYLTGMLSYLAFLERSSLKFPRRIDNSLDDFTNVKQLVNLLSLQILLTHLLTNTTVWFQFNAFKSFLQP